jgi:hypothetical protein
MLAAFTSEYFSSVSYLNVQIFKCTRSLVWMWNLILHLKARVVENRILGRHRKVGITGNWRYYDSTTSLYFLIKLGNYDKH